MIKYSTMLKAGILQMLLLGTIQAMGQIGISGKVTDQQTGEAIPGASIIVKGTSSGTGTNAEGTYELSVPDSRSVLIFSFVGFSTQEIAVNGQSKIDVALRTDLKQLNEVVVTALGIKKDVRRIGVAIQTVDGTSTVKAREPNAINALAGKVAGLTIGAQPELLRRPNIMLRGNTDVLFVVDGVPVNSDTWNVSPDDIDTYSVLKGASASALYGFRGKNGAILITTKRGTKDKRGFSVDVNSSTMMDKGFYSIPKVQDEYGPGDHGRYAFVNGAGGGLNDGDYDGGWGPRFEGQPITQYDSPVDPITGVRSPTPWINRGKDNLRRFLRPGILSTNNVSVSSTGDKYNLRFSASNTFQKGIVPNTKLNITNFNVTGDFRFSDKLSFTSNLQYNRQYSPNIPDVNYGPNSIIYNMVFWAGADWNVDDMRNYWQPGKEGVQQIYAEYQRYNNPYFMSYEWLRGHQKSDIIGQAAMTYKINSFLEATLRTQITTWNLFRNEKMPYSAGSYGREERRGDYREDRRNLFENNTDILVKFDKDLFEGFNTKIWAGGNIRSFEYSSQYGSTDYLNVPGLYNFNNSYRPVKTSNFNSAMRVNSAYYSADFTFRDYFTLSTTGRVDKLSTLPAGNNTFFYPSVAGSTVLSDYLPVPEVISFLKLRASYANVKDGLTRSTIGTTPALGDVNPLGYGDQYYSPYDGPTYQNAAVYSTPFAYNNAPAAYFTNTLNNPGLKPSTTSQTEIGLDVRVLRNRLGLDMTYFVSHEGPRIFALPISSTTGYESYLVNGIQTKKTGFELALTGSVLAIPNGLNWDVVANYSTFKEVLTDIYPGVNALNTFFKAGDRLDKFYGRAFARTQDGQIINDESGRPVYLPVNQYLGNINPKFVFGINNKFAYKNVNVSFQVDGRIGGVISNYVQKQTFRGGRNAKLAEGVLGDARYQDWLGFKNGETDNKNYLGEGVQISNGKALNYDVDGKITNLAELQFAPNTTKQYVQDWVSRYYNSDEGNLMSRSFAMLREVVIGYTIPSKWLVKSKFIRNASVSLVGRNLLYFAESKDIDLNQYTSGGESSPQTPSMRRYGVNVNLSF
ncbi:SusC/RagA family TonB-linked outer membrane protein [Dyadobacter sediminis]|uniref:SusC/RagA family TonB-linked outer membrane protein n=1 Tax=Dyadobacter sediminis TaxID=1493691 RepID=A0A5R9KBD7_9BACT|nr:SusC/RagA family TonB-linked outer membrane protein [Dyadobacter sediminis]TLU92131.1 SusC/RagA family TonB-linked outer membrane protein [Dyadobacter sediminis]GGB97167.1 SusC/RagA family TonB-linked outer membrane protein [Dyadobacter sediminis]